MIYEFEIYAVPDSDGDYNFSFVAIVISDGTDMDTYCRF